jgi:pyruvate decarboxylase
MKFRRTGVFWGQVSTLAADSILNWADTILCVGTIFTDYSTVGWTALPNVPLIVAEMDHVMFPGATFDRVRLGDFLSGLAKTVDRNDSTMIEYGYLRPDPSLVHVASQMNC